MIGVIQIVTMDHPQSRIVCIEGDLIGFMRSYTDGVEMDRTSCEQMPILCQHRKCMSMQMHRVIACICVVHKTQPDQLSRFDHEHGSMRESIPIQRKDGPRAHIGKAKGIAKRDGICHIEMAIRRDGIRCWMTVGCEIEDPLAGFRNDEAGWEIPFLPNQQTGCRLILPIVVCWEQGNRP